MNAVIGSLLAALVIALSGLAGTLGASWISNRANGRAERMRLQGEEARNAIESRKVDQTEFDAITRELRKNLEEVKLELVDERAARRKAESRITLLEQALQAANLPVPPPT